MNRVELFDGAREIIDDQKPQEKISDERMLRHFNEAIDEACRRTRVLDDSRSSFCTIVFQAGVPSYQLDRCIFAVRRIRVDGQRYPLEMVDTADLDWLTPGWDDPTIVCKRCPQYAVFNLDTGRMTVSPTPDINYTARMLVWRCPTDSEKLTLDNDCEPILPRHMHRELKHWVAGQVYLNEDSELKNSGEAATQFALFDAAYGEKPDLHEMRLWSTNHRKRVKAHFD